MKSTPILFSLLVAAALVGCAKDQVVEQKAPDDKVILNPVKGLSNIRLANYELGASVQVDNMTIIPLKPKRAQASAQDGKPLVDYITLSEATKMGVIEIDELDSPTVEVLRVRNTGKQPILLVGGDLLLGGQQDRVVQEDTVIEPGQSAAVKVFCVERGRWEGGSKFGSGGKVPYSVRKEAEFGGGQGAVWSEVSGINASFNADSRITSVRAGLAAAEDRISPNVQKFLAELKKQDGVVGAVFVIDGKVEAMDVFANSKLFAASSDSLLRGFVTEAVASKKKIRTAPADKDIANFVNRYGEMRSFARTRSGEGIASRKADGFALKEVRAKGNDSTLPAIHGFMASD
jgi:hypothetical protein